MHEFRSVCFHLFDKTFRGNQKERRLERGRLKGVVTCLVIYHLETLEKKIEATLIVQWLRGRLLGKNKRQELSSRTIPQVIARCDSSQISSGI